MDPGQGEVDDLCTMCNHADNGCEQAGGIVKNLGIVQGNFGGYMSKSHEDLEEDDGDGTSPGFDCR